MRPVHQVLSTVEKEFDELPPSKLLNEVWEDRKQLKISLLDSEMLQGTRSSFAVTLEEAVDSYINEPTKSTTFHVRIFYQLGERLLQRLHELFEMFKILPKPIFLVREITVN